MNKLSVGVQTPSCMYYTISLRKTCLKFTLMSMVVTIHYQWLCFKCNVSYQNSS